MKTRLAWAAQALSGALLVLLLGLHWAAEHSINAGGLRGYASVVSYLRNPAVFVLEALFLLTVTAHALLGVRAVLLDLGPTPHTQKWLERALWLLGVLTVAYGLQLAWQIVR